jgi:ketosteroid isomerase-like protein
VEGDRVTEQSRGLDVEQDRQARIDLIKTYWDALMSADLVTYRTLLAPDAVIHYPGQNFLSGDYTTTDDIVELYRTLTGFVTQGTFTGQVLDITTGEQYTTVILKYQLHLPMKTVDGRATGLFLLDENYKIKEYWLHEWNQVMINRVLRATWACKPFMPLVNRIKRGKK